MAIFFIREFREFREVKERIVRCGKGVAGCALYGD